MFASPEGSEAELAVLLSAKSGALPLRAAGPISAGLNNLITARVVGPSVVAIGNTIVIAVAIHATDHTITVVISAILMTSLDRVNDAAGKTADRNQHCSKFLHSFLLRAKYGASIRP